MGGVQQAFYAEILTNDTPTYCHNLGNIFDFTEEQVYVDSGHLNPRGNLIVAEKIADIIAIALEQTSACGDHSPL